MAGIPIDAEGRFSGYASIFNRLDSGVKVLRASGFHAVTHAKRSREERANGRAYPYRATQPDDPAHRRSRSVERQ